MANLTEKLKTGKLKKEKSYYVETSADRVFIKRYSSSKGFTGIVKEVLAEVPSYEKYQAFKNEIQELKSERDKLAYDLGVADTLNGRLFRLLKECQHYIINTPILAQGDEQKTKQIHELLNKIEKENRDD